jgi:hypothetical protein
MSAYTEYAAQVEHNTSLSRFTDVATLSEVDKLGPTPVSGDMLTVLKRDTRRRVRTRRFLFRALEGSEE